MPANSIPGRKAASPAATPALDKIGATAAPDTKLSPAFKAALGGGPKQPHLSSPGHANARTVERDHQSGRGNGKGPAGPGLSAGFDARRGHK